jgi:hypothetical protein
MLNPASDDMVLAQKKISEQIELYLNNPICELICSFQLNSGSKQNRNVNYLMYFKLIHCLKLLVTMSMGKSLVKLVTS